MFLVGAIPPLPPSASMACSGTPLLFFFFTSNVHKHISLYNVLAQIHHCFFKQTLWRHWKCFLLLKTCLSPSCEKSSDCTTSHQNNLISKGWRHKNKRSRKYFVWVSLCNETHNKGDLICRGLERNVFFFKKYFQWTDKNYVLKK
jgi:hypothetical protein